jgi:hypothetical protein
MSNLKTDMFVENIYRLKHKLIKVEIFVSLDYETHVPDLMTRMRSLIGFAVVGQTKKVDRLQGGGARIGLSVKYLPDSSDIYKNLDSMAAAIKSLPGVKTIKVVTYNKRPILKNGTPILY